MGASLCADPEELAAMGRSYGIRTQKKPEGKESPSGFCALSGF